MMLYRMLWTTWRVMSSSGTLRRRSRCCLGSCECGFTVVPSGSVLCWCRTVVFMLDC